MKSRTPTIEQMTKNVGEFYETADEWEVAFSAAFGLGGRLGLDDFEVVGDKLMFKEVQTDLKYTEKYNDLGSLMKNNPGRGKLFLHLVNGYHKSKNGTEGDLKLGLTFGVGRYNHTEELNVQSSAPEQTMEETTLQEQ